MNEIRETSPEEYTVVVGARLFVLSRSQIEHDSPNYFTSYFYYNSKQTNPTRLDISRDPHIFELVLKYLNGYHVTPIHDSLVPPTSTRRTTLADLRADAEFYQLRGLVVLCKLEQKQILELSAHHAIATGCLHMSSEGYSPEESKERFVPRFYLSPLSEDLYEKATTGMLAWNNTTADSTQLLIMYGWSHQIVASLMNKHAPTLDDWKIVGWKQYNQGAWRHLVIFVKIWVRDGEVLKF